MKLVSNLIEPQRTPESSYERARRIAGDRLSPLTPLWAWRDGRSLVRLVDTKALHDAADDGSDQASLPAIVELSPEAALALIENLKNTADFATSMAMLIPAAVEAGAEAQDFADAMGKLHKAKPTRGARDSLMGSLLGQSLLGGVGGF